MKIESPNFLLRAGVAVILIMHSVPGMFNNGVNQFGYLYLDNVGFAPFGIFLAWAIKLSHVGCALTLLLDRYMKCFAWITIAILIVGIVMVHAREGWFVVGSGRNGVEFNFLLIIALVTVLYPDGFKKRPLPRS